MSGRSVALRNAREREAQRKQDVALEKVGIDRGLQDEDRAELDRVKELKSKPVPKTNPKDQEAYTVFVNSEFSAATERMNNKFGEKAVEEHLNPKPVDDSGPVLSDKDSRTISYIESGNNPRARNKNSSARGLYQYIDDTWKTLMNTPEGKAAGLTRNGRYDPEQSKKAFEISTRISARNLRSKNIPVNVHTIYLAHHFGDGAAVRYGKEIYTNKGNQKLPKGFLTAKIVKANPWLKGVKTAGDFREGLNGLLQKGLTLEANAKIKRKQ